MSSTIPNWFVTKYEREVSDAFQQSTSKLRDTFRNITGVPDKFSVPTSESIEAVDDRPRYSKFEARENSRGDVTVTLKDVEAWAMFRDEDQFRVNADLRKDTTDNLVAAINRKLDSYIIAALNTTATGELTATQLTATALVSAQRALNLAEVPDEDRYAVISSYAYEDIMGDNKLTSRDYVSEQILKSGMINYVNGFTLRRSNLLPAGTNGSDTRCFFYPKRAGVLGIGQDLKVRIDYIPDGRYWQVLATMSANAALVRPEAVFRMSVANS